MSAIASISEVNSGEVYSQPNSRFVFCSPRHPVSAVSGDKNVIARPKIALPFALNTETR
jgi:hypothetical protein